MNTEKIIGADGFMNEVGTAKAASSVATIKESDKTANQLYNEYKADEKKKGNNKLVPFKDWLKKAQAEGTLKNIQEQTMSLIGDVVEIAKHCLGVALPVNWLNTQRCATSSNNTMGSPAFVLSQAPPKPDQSVLPATGVPI